MCCTPGLEESGKKLVATAGVTALVTEGFYQLLNHIRGTHGLPPIEEDQDLSGVKTGGALIITAAVVPSENAPFVAGVGTGVAARSIMRNVLPPPGARPKVYRSVAADEGGATASGRTLKVHQLPETSREAKWREVAAIFRNMMNEDHEGGAGEFVPAERWHPDVVGYARNLVATSNIDATDAEQVVRAIWTHFRTTYTGGKFYAWDPNKADYFVAPHVFLTPYAEGGYGMVGDCDDVSMAVAAILLALGYNAGLMLVKQPRHSDFNHVVPVALLPEKYAKLVPPNDTRYRTRLPSGETAIVIPLEFTRPRPWLYFPKYAERGFVFFDAGFEG